MVKGAVDWRVVTVGEAMLGWKQAISKTAALMKEVLNILKRCRGWFTVDVGE